MCLQEGSQPAARVIDVFESVRSHGTCASIAVATTEAATADAGVRICADHHYVARACTCDSGAQRVVVGIPFRVRSSRDWSVPRNKKDPKCVVAPSLRAYFFSEQPRSDDPRAEVHVLLVQCSSSLRAERNSCTLTATAVLRRWRRANEEPAIFQKLFSDRAPCLLQAGGEGTAPAQHVEQLRLACAVL